MVRFELCKENYDDLLQLLDKAGNLLIDSINPEEQAEGYRLKGIRTVLKVTARKTA